MILIPDHVPSHFISCPLKFIIGGIISSQSSFFKSSAIDPSYLPFNSWSPCDLWYFLYIAYCELNPIAAVTTVHNNCSILLISPPLFLLIVALIAASWLIVVWFVCVFVAALWPYWHLEAKCHLITSFIHMWAASAVIMLHVAYTDITYVVTSTISLWLIRRKRYVGVL